MKKGEGETKSNMSSSSVAYERKEIHDGKICVRICSEVIVKKNANAKIK